MIVFFVSLFVFLAIGVPILFALLLSGISLMSSMEMFEAHIVAQRFIDGINSYSLLAVPFFVLAGELMNKCGITKRIIKFAMTFIGHIRGGLGYVATITSVIFAGLSGSAIADTAAVGTSLLPSMSQYGYDKKKCNGLIIASGIIGPIIPPSTGLIIYGVTTETSIMQLFMAGLIPGILFGLVCIIMWNIVTRKDTSMITIGKTSFKEKVGALKDALWALILPVFIIGGLRIGIFTATEAGVAAVFYSLFIGLFVYREIKVKDLYDIFLSSAKTTGTVLILCGAGSVVSWYITLSDLPTQISSLLGRFIDSPRLLLIIIFFILLVVGMVMDITPSTLILAPLFLEITNQAGIDPVYFGIIFMLTLTVGLITPPVGTVLYTGMRISGLNLSNALKGAWPFIVAELAVILLMILFPQILMVPLSYLI